MQRSFSELSFQEIAEGSVCVAKAYIKETVGMFTGANNLMDRLALTGTLIFFVFSIGSYCLALGYWSVGDQVAKQVLWLPIVSGVIYAVLMVAWIFVRWQNISRKSLTTPTQPCDITHPNPRGKYIVLLNCIEAQFGRLDLIELRSLTQKIAETRLMLANNDLRWLERSGRRQLRGSLSIWFPASIATLSLVPIVAWVEQANLAVGVAILVALLLLWVSGALVLSVLLMWIISWREGGGEPNRYALWLMHNDLIELLR